jgi:hypothetical protein
MAANVAAAVGQTITVASGQSLILTSIEPEQGTQNNFPGMVADFFNTIIPAVAQKLGSSGHSLTVQDASALMGNQNLGALGDVNAGFSNNAVGNVNQNDYNVIPPAMGQYLTAQNGRQGAVAKFAFAAEGLLP